MDLGSKIKKIRKDNNLTQEELAKKIYVTRTAISKWETNKGFPSIDNLQTISSLFNVSINELLSSNELVSLACINNEDQEIKHKLQLFSFADVVSFLLLFLPIYAKEIEGYYYSMMYYDSSLTKLNIILYTIVFSLFLVIAFLEWLLSIVNINKKKLVFIFSILYTAFVLSFVIATSEAYAGLMILVLLMVKILVILINVKKGIVK